MRIAFHWRISEGAVLALALFWFFDASGLFAAAIPAVLVHECGHIAALLLCGASLRGIRIGLTGIQIDYVNLDSLAGSLFALAAGPGAGLFYALLACRFGDAYLRLSGAVSLAFTLFNLLPVLPLDGGRLAAAILGERSAQWVSRIAAPLLLIAGAALLLTRRTPGLLFSAAWLTAQNYFYED